jgi:hypothetical protein
MNPHYEAIKLIIQTNMTPSDKDGWPWVCEINIAPLNFVRHGQWPDKERSLKDIMQDFTLYFKKEFMNQGDYFGVNK